MPPHAKNGVIRQLISPDDFSCEQVIKVSLLTAWLITIQQHMVLTSEPQLPTTSHSKKAEDGYLHQSLKDISSSASIVCCQLVLSPQYFFSEY